MDHSSYTVGWICALPVERAAAIASLDEEHDGLEQPLSDQNIYKLGRIGPHNVAIASLPAGETGIASAATVATQMLNTFPSVRVGLMVGVGGGAPSKENDIRLGDVVVSEPTKTSGGVVQYDFGRTVETGRFIQTGSLNAPPRVLLNAVGTLQAEHMRKEPELELHLAKLSSRSSKWAKSVAYPGDQHDVLFEASYDHAGNDDSDDCTNCDKTKLIRRGSRDSTSPGIHYGAIASANQVMRHGATRDAIAKQHGVICFEMEAAGLTQNFPCLVVRGICDYADSHKNKHWQPYAAATAAAYAKELLLIVPGSGIRSTRTASTAIRMNELLQRLQYDEIYSRKGHIYDAPEDSFGWIWDEERTDTSFVDWLSNERPLFWIRGKAGSGKSTLMKYIAGHERTGKMLQPGTVKGIRNMPWVVLDFFFDFRAGKELANNFEGLLRCLLLGLVKKVPDVAKDLDILQEVDAKGQLRDRLPIFRLQSSLKQALASCGSNVCMFLDGLDEYDGRYLDLIDFVFNVASETHASTNRVKICLASRPEPLILESFAKLPGFVVEEHNGISIHTYVRNRFESNLQHSAGDAGLREVRTKITGLARGIFLWARLATNEAVERYSEGAHTFELLQALEDLPSDLEAVYARMLGRVKLQYRYEASIMLQLISHAAVSIQLDTLFAAVRTAIDGDLPDLNDSRFENFDKRVRAFTGGLVELTFFFQHPGNKFFRKQNTEVRLIHETVGKYLTRPQTLQNFVQAAAEDQDHPEELWIRICATSIEKFGPEALKISLSYTRPSLQQKVCFALDSLQRYALSYIVLHASRFEESTHQSAFPLIDRILSEHLERFSLSASHLNGATVVRLPEWNFWNGREPGTVLCLAASNGLLLCCEDKIRSGADVNENDGRALQAALANRQEATVLTLLRAGARCNESHMIQAVGSFSLEIVKRMLGQLDHLPSPNLMLHAAAGTTMPWNSRAENIVSYLVAWGCNINQPVRFEGTPLHACLTAAFTSVRDKNIRRRIKFMLDLGASVNAEDPKTGETPFDVAFLVLLAGDRGYEAYVDDLRFFFEIGAKPSKRGLVLIERVLSSHGVSMYSDEFWNLLRNRVRVVAEYLSE